MVIKAYQMYRYLFFVLGNACCKHCKEAVRGLVTVTIILFKVLSRQVYTAL